MALCEGHAQGDHAEGRHATLHRSARTATWSAQQTPSLLLLLRRLGGSARALLLTGHEHFSPVVSVRKSCGAQLLSPPKNLLNVQVSSVTNRQNHKSNRHPSPAEPSSDARPCRRRGSSRARICAAPHPLVSLFFVPSDVYTRDED